MCEVDCRPPTADDSVCHERLLHRGRSVLPDVCHGDVLGDQRLGISTAESAVRMVGVTSDWAYVYQCRACSAVLSRGAYVYRCCVQKLAYDERLGIGYERCVRFWRWAYVHLLGTSLVFRVL